VKLSCARARRVGRRVIASLVASLCVFASEREGEAASDTTLAPRFELTAPAECIDEATFRARLAKLEASRTKREPPRRISIRIVEEKGGVFAGRLSVEHADGRITARTVAADHCDDVVEALELVAAVALGLEQHAVQPTPPPVLPKAVVEAREEGLDRPPAVGQEPRRWHVTGGAHAGAIGALGRGLAFAPSVSVGTMFDGRGWFAPSLELVGTWAEGTTIATALGSASLRLLDAALSGCPLRISLSDAVALRPCVEFHVGSIRATAAGPTLTGDTTASRPWMATGAFARAEWRVARSLLLDAQAGATFALLQERFYFTPATTISELPFVAGTFKVGARFAWP
jgi:hypothetical protein